MAECEEFVVVRGKRGKKGGRNRPKPKITPTLNCAINDCDDDFDMISFTKRLDSCKQEVHLSEFFHKSYDQIVSCLNQMCDSLDQFASCGEENTPSVFESVETCKRTTYMDTENHQKLLILSYGIGNFTSCLIARYQLAYLLALRDKLGDLCSACEVFDPVFTTHEKAVLEAYKCEVSPHNEEGKRSCLTKTIVFMPHCGKALYNNLLWRNSASPGSALLFNVMLIGNSFANMVERTPKSQLEKTANYVLKLQPFVKEIQLDNIFIHKDIFNDLALHWFPRSIQDSMMVTLGNCEEPVYDGSDVEFIRS